MPRFFTDNSLSKKAVITGEDAKHIAKSLRMTAGEKLTLCDGRGIDYDCVITSLSLDRIDVDVMSQKPTETEPRIKATLYQAIPKGEKFDLIIQKAVELGVSRIVPFISERCVSRPQGPQTEKKRERWQKISLEAAKQSGRGIVPEISPIIHFETMLALLKEHEKSVFFYEAGKVPVKTFLQKPCGDIALVVGSEGGFAENEVQKAEHNGCAVATLGKRILRCETAPITALSIVMYQYGELE